MNNHNNTFSIWEKYTFKLIQISWLRFVENTYFKSQTSLAWHVEKMYHCKTPPLIEMYSNPATRDVMLNCSDFKSHLLYVQLIRYRQNDNTIPTVIPVINVVGYMCVEFQPTKNRKSNPHVETDGFNGDVLVEVWQVGWVQVTAEIFRQGPFLAPPLKLPFHLQL